MRSGRLKHLKARFVRQLRRSGVPIQPQMPPVFPREHHFEGFRFGEVPMDFLFHGSTLVDVGVERAPMKAIHEGNVLDASFFPNFPPYGGLMTRVARFDVALGEIPVTLRVLEQEHRSKIDQHHATRGLHASPNDEVLMCFAAPRHLDGPPSTGRGMVQASFPEVGRIVADADLDGLCAAAILQRVLPGAEVIFAHPALIRSGHLDEVIDRGTAIVDLPFHPACGWYVDHHLTNRPNDVEAATFEAAGGRLDWAAEPSAARVAHNLVAPVNDLEHLADLMPFVDAIDSGGIDRDVFLADGPLVRLARCLGTGHADFMHHVLNLLVSGTTAADLVGDSQVAERLAAAAEDRNAAIEAVQARTTVVDRLAICRMDGLPQRASGYLVTAHVGEDADACCVIHGHVDGAVERDDRPPLSASFYANSFFEGRRRVDLSRLATSLDETGGGHANACGCRVQAINDAGMAVDRPVEAEDVERNLAHWLALWASLPSLE